MVKPVSLRRVRSGVYEAIVKRGLDNSVDARNFLAQIGHLVSYDGPQSTEIVFRIDTKSARQASEWNLKRLDVRKRLINLSGVRMKYPFFDTIWAKTKQAQEIGIYSPGLTQPKRQFWTKLRIIQAFWLLKAFNKPINFRSLQSGLRSAIYRGSETWAELVSFAGFDPEEETSFPLVRESWPRQRILKTLKDRKKKGLPINSWALQKECRGMSPAMVRIFGCWEGAIKAVGFDPDKERRGSPKPLTKAEVIERIIKRYSSGEILNNTVEYKEPNLYHSAEKRFDDWRGAIIAAGIDPSEVVNTIWTPGLVTQTLKRLKSSGEPIYAAYLSKKHSSLYGAARRLFGTWASAVRSAGFDPEKETTRPDLIAENRRYWDTDVVIEGLKRLKDRGEPIYGRYIKTRDPALYSAMVRYFGSWEEAIVAAGFEPDQERKKWFWDKDRIISELQDMKSQGAPVNPKYIKTTRSGFYEVMRRYFGSWSEAVKAAGLDPEIEARRPTAIGRRS